MTKRSAYIKRIDAKRIRANDEGSQSAYKLNREGIVGDDENVGGKNGSKEGSFCRVQSDKYDSIMLRKR